MKAWTDYPITELGDEGGKEAPIREVEVQSWDGERYCTVFVDGIITSIKAGYLYERAGRFGKVPAIDVSKLPNEQIHFAKPLKPTLH